MNNVYAELKRDKLILGIYLTLDRPETEHNIRTVCVLWVMSIVVLVLMCYFDCGVLFPCVHRYRQKRPNELFCVELKLSELTQFMGFPFGIKYMYSSL